QSIMSWLLLFPGHPGPLGIPMVGPKVEDGSALYAALQRDLTMVRVKPYSQSIEAFAKADAADDPISARDHDQLQGIWRGIAGFAMGQRLKDDEVRQVIMTFAGNTAETPPSPGNKGGKGTFKLDATKTPKHIRVTEEIG